MTLVKSPTELSTAATDLLLAGEGLLLLLWLWFPHPHDRTRAYLWSTVFGLVFFASFLGAAAHGLEMRASLRETLFVWIFLSLGMVVILLAAGAVMDRWGWESVRGRIWVLWALTLAMFLWMRWVKEVRPIGVVYVALAFLTALILYLSQALSGLLPGAVWIAASLFIGLIGAFVQSRKFVVTLLYPLDQNGVFHLIALAALALLGRGVRMGM